MSPDPSRDLRRGYRIYRLRTDAADPLASIAFDPPKDSPTLRQALELAYPDAASHEARIRDAIIDFLISERNNESTINDTTSNIHTIPADAAIEVSDVDDRQQLGAIEPHPELGDIKVEIPTSHSFQTGIDDDDDDLGESERQSNHSTSSAWKSMTAVWNPFNRKVSKRGRKTPMTKEEKEEYRKIRKQGACSDCKKRKRKCNDDHYAVSITDKPTAQPRLRRKINVDPENLPPLDEAPPDDALPLPDLGLSFAGDSGFLNFVLGQNSAFDPHGHDESNTDGHFSSDDYTADLWKPRILSHKSSNLSEKRRSFLSYYSEPGMTMAPSIDSMSLHPVDAVEPLSFAPARADDLAGLFINDEGGGGAADQDQGLHQLGLDADAGELQGSSKAARHPDIAWLSAWDQLFDVSLDEARSSLEVFSMAGDEAKS